MLSITGLSGAVWSEKCGNTLCEKAFTSSSLYCEQKMQSQSQEAAAAAASYLMAFSSHLQAARAEEAAEQAAPLGE